MKVLVSIPNTGWVHKLVSRVRSKLEMDRQHEVRVIDPTHNPYENSLSKIVNDFMSGDWDYWLNMDSDNPPMKNPLDLLAYELDVIGLPTPIWHFTDKIKGERPFYFNGYDYVEEKDAYREHLPQEGLQEVDAVGTGCVLIARRVFDDPEMRKAPFARQWNEDGTVNKGNDISFCERARARGFRIFCHYDYPCMHFNELELNEVVRGFAGVYE